jgi:hypothetical protein
VGDRVKYGGHKGTLTAYDPKTKFWTILFDDGKEEDAYREHEFQVLAEQQPEIYIPPYPIPQKDNEKERNNAYGLLKMWLSGHYANGLEEAFNAEESTINKIKQHFSEFDPAWQWDENYQAAWNQLKAELPAVPIDNKSAYPYQDPELEQQYIYGLLKMWLRDCYGDSVRQAFDGEQTTINKIKEHFSESDPAWQWGENYQKMWDRLRSEFSQSSKFPINITFADAIKSKNCCGTD